MMIQTIVYCMTILGLFYYYFTYNFNFWKVRGVKGPKPVFFFGNAKEYFLGKLSMGEYIEIVYRQYKKEPLIGLFWGREPILVVKDPELIKAVLVKDFESFPDRKLVPSPKVDPLSNHLGNYDAARWKALRNQLTPAFTTAKLKVMFSSMLECAEQLERCLSEIVDEGEPVEVLDLTAQFIIDVIGMSAFGIETNAMTDEQSEFRKMGKKAANNNIVKHLREILREMPRLFNVVGGVLTDTRATDFFRNIMNEVSEYRIRNNIRRQDFFEKLLELKMYPDKLGTNQLEESFVVAHIFVFFTTGYMTSSSMMANILYELGKNQPIQDKLRNELKEVTKKHNGVITYEGVDEMKYLHAVFEESLRKYPGFSCLSRICSESYTFEGTDVTIPKGQKVYIPVSAIQHNPEIYPNPDVFDPERFTEENVKNRNPMYFLPFGDGRRNCIGKRYVYYATKAGIIKMLLNYNFEVCNKTPSFYTYEPKLLCRLQPNQKTYLKASRIK